MPGTRRDRRRGSRRQSVEEDAPSELPPEASPESEVPVDPIPEPDPPIEDPVEDEASEDDPSVEIPGPAEVPESVMEAMAGNLSDVGTTTKDSWPADHTPKKVGMLHLEGAEPVEALETEEEVPEPPGRARERRRQARRARSRPAVVEVSTSSGSGSLGSSTEDEITGLKAVAEEGRAELERGETRPLTDLMHEMLPPLDNETAELIDKMLNGGEIVAAVVPEEIASEPIKVVVLDTGQDPPQIEDLHESEPEFDTYTIRVPKGTVIALEKQE